MLMYIHGFNSSAQSFKARVLRDRMRALGRPHEFSCPNLPHEPRYAIASLQHLIGGRPAGSVTLVGSSLGGYYATWLAENRGARAVLVNPAVRPYELLEDYVGTQTNLYSGERYEFTGEHVRQLRALEVERITRERYLLMVQTGDEVLDYAQAVEKYRGCRQIVIGGGDHGFSDFADYADAALSFCGYTQRSRVPAPLQ